MDQTKVIIALVILVGVVLAVFAMRGGLSRFGVKIPGLKIDAEGAKPGATIERIDTKGDDVLVNAKGANATVQDIKNRGKGTVFKAES